MDARTVIESYVHDVTQLLRRKDRADVALELRALLTEELAARTGGAPADEAMAIELVRSFGAPSEVAARYRPATPLLDAADTRPFLMAALIGALVIMTGVAVAPSAVAHPPRPPTPPPARSSAGSGSWSWSSRRAAGPGATGHR